MARAYGNAEESNLESGGRAIHGICPRGRKIDCGQAAISQVVINAKSHAVTAPLRRWARCSFWNGDTAHCTSTRDNFLSALPRWRSIPGDQDPAPITICA